MEVCTIEQHGMSHTKEYNTWCHMKNRCYNKNNKRYKHYGGRGITVCDRWLHSFMAFFEDMGSKLFSKAQIDRIDNDGNYEPGNCRWTTCTENNRNRRFTKLTINKAKTIRKLYKSTEITITRLAKKYGIDRHTVRDCVNYLTWREGGIDDLSIM